MRDKIQLLASIYYENKQIFKKDQVQQATTCQPKSYYLHFSPESRLRRLIDLLIAHQQHSPAEQYAQEYLAKFGKASKYAASSLLEARFLNLMNQYFGQRRRSEGDALTTEQKDLLLNSLKSAVLQINECFSVSKTSSGYQYYSGVLVQPLHELLVWEQRKEVSFGFKSVLSQHRAALYKMRLEILYGLTLAFFTQNKLMPSSQTLEVCDNVKMISTALARREDKYNYFAGLCWYYVAELTKELIQRNE